MIDGGCSERGGPWVRVEKVGGTPLENCMARVFNGVFLVGSLSF